MDASLHGEVPATEFGGSKRPSNTPWSATSATHFVPAGRFGPWVPGITETERRCGLRALAALTAVFAGSDNPAVAALRRAEVDATAADEALALFDRLPALRRRHVLAVYARIMCPRQRPGGAQ